MSERHFLLRLDPTLLNDELVIVVDGEWTVATRHERMMIVLPE